MSAVPRSAKLVEIDISAGPTWYDAVEKARSETTIPAKANAPRQRVIAASLAAARVRASATPRRIAGRSSP